MCWGTTTKWLETRTRAVKLPPPPNPRQGRVDAVQEGGSRERKKRRDWALQQEWATSAGAAHVCSIPCFTEFLLQCPLG